MGELILGRKDDGTLEIIRADDEITIPDELLEDIPSEGEHLATGAHRGSAGTVNG